MANLPLFDPATLYLQIQRQKKYAWDLENGISWEKKVNGDLPLAPLDSDCIAFPGASDEQRLVLSQYVGLIINSTIAEMEDVVNKLRQTAWSDVLRSYPVGPEMWELGELFFQEERKHAVAFTKYNEIFCESTGVDSEALDTILPKAYGSLFLKSVLLNAKWGGHALWWIVAAVEEVSISIYKNLHPVRSEIDPLYHEVHLKHMEEEARHHNYAFLMLEVLQQRNKNFMQYFYSKADLVLGQFMSIQWSLAEMSKIFEAKRFRETHPFFEVLASCEPLLRKLPPHEILKRLFVAAPHISLFLNSHFHKETSETAKKHGVFSLPFPKPKSSVQR